MAKDDIKKAKAENAERIANIAYSGGGHIGQDDLETAFENGADWRINSVWHTMDVVPEREVLLALHGYGRTITIKWNGDMKWKGMDKFFRAEKWAYMDDLLPNKEN